ncbi:S9 family peptidase [Salibacter halophilus]|uniref:Proline-specific endopeptidase n=1 Tax=Salibacter halophilus TaxID=1803916 RepID=A0A6N6M6A3_9FLAO|nr:S9 family peptidase [Salibacter halophilus]KAB1063932.1 S9 family peptidase [Salibacter halophilus]
MDAPKAKHIDFSLAAHGETRIDPFYWMRDRESDEVLQHLRNENAFTEEKMKDTEELQEKLFAEMKGRIKEDDESVPYTLRGYEYRTKFEKGNEYPVFLRRKVEEKEEKVILDQNQLAEGKEFHSLGGMSLSVNNKLLAFGEDTLSRRIYKVRFKNLENGEFLDDVLDNTTGSVAWANDNKTVFYAMQDETLRPSKIYRHVLGSDQKDDELIYEEKDATFLCYAFKSKSEKYIMIGSASSVSNEYRYLPADEPNGEFQLFDKRERDHEYSIAHYNDHFYILTNKDARNFKVMKTPEYKTTQENWESVIEHRDDVMIENMELFQNFMVTEERENGLVNLCIRPWEGDMHEIKFSDPAYVAYIGINPDFNTDNLRYGYTSLTTPPSVYLYNMKTREQELLKQHEVVGGYNQDEYKSERLYATARDGKQVPISLVYKKDMHRDGQSQPLLLYGYGSYGISTDPSFSSIRLSLLDRGFIFAIAHIRGGEDLGRDWYLDGKWLNKMNTFTDFIDCAEHLIEKNYTGQSQLYALGGSAGGMLMGAIINMRPDLWNGVVAAVPFVDVVTTMLDESIPLTTGEYDEWGNPNDETYYRYMLRYSPYDNVEPKDYPNLLVTTGFHDSQVQYWEPAKWVAKLREKKTDQNLLLMKVNLDAGHGGSSGRFKRLRETALDYAFLLMLENRNR